MVIIVVDLGHFKAYRVIKSSLESTRIELLREYDAVNVREKFSEKVSDSAGRFAAIKTI